MSKRILKLILAFLILVSIIIGLFVYSSYVSIENVEISYSTVKSPSIGEQLNDIEIGFFSDIHYGGYMNQKRLDKMVQTINENSTDILLFGGDIFDLSKGLPSPEVQAEMITILSSLNAPLGKFAVLGSIDNSSQEIRDIVKHVLLESNFELLDNKNIFIRKGEDQSIGIIGIDSNVNGTPILEQAFSQIQPTNYNIVLSHSPNLIDLSEFQAASINLFLAGNGFSSQIHIPVLGVLGDMVGHGSYNNGTYHIGNTQLVISNGLGTVGSDIRLLLPPTFYVFRLQHSLE